MQQLHNSGHNTWLTFVTKTRDLLKPSTDSTALALSDIKLLKSRLKEQYALFWEQTIMDDTKSKSINGRKLRTYIGNLKPGLGGNTT